MEPGRIELAAFVGSSQSESQKAIEFRNPFAGMTHDIRDRFASERIWRGVSPGSKSRMERMVPRAPATSSGSSRRVATCLQAVWLSDLRARLRQGYEQGLGRAIPGRSWAGLAVRAAAAIPARGSRAQRSRAASRFNTRALSLAPARPRRNGCLFFHYCTGLTVAYGQGGLVRTGLGIRSQGGPRLVRTWAWLGCTRHGWACWTCGVGGPGRGARGGRC